MNLLGLGACLPDPAPGVLPRSDLAPPLLLEALPVAASRVELRFSEDVQPLEGSFALSPSLAAAPPRAQAEGGLLRVELGAAQEPGRAYTLAGEVADGAGNRTRFVLSFCGWNDRPPTLRLSELQTGKNSSKTRPHRDYVELEVLGPGNLGGVELAWASSVKAYSYRFPAAELRAGDFVVLHLAPEGLPEERDETGADLALSGGVDATATGRDFWSAAGGIPDESGALLLRLRPGGPAVDGLVYGDEAKSGGLGENRLGELAAELGAGAVWPFSGSPAWEEAFLWKPSTARPLCRIAGTGRGAWFVAEAGGQSPGGPNPTPP